MALSRIQAVQARNQVRDFRRGRGLRGFLQTLAFAGLFALGLGSASGAASQVRLSPGAYPCKSALGPAGYGTYILLRQADFQQSSASALPVETSAQAQIELTPPSLFSITNAAISGPGTFSAPLTTQTDGTSTWSSTGTESSLAAQFPAGLGAASFRLGFTNGTSFIGFFPFTLGSAVPPIPQIANFDAAQGINALTAFTLNWSGWIGSSTNDRIQLTITDAAGTVVVSAATDCTGESTLATGATSFTIPAGKLIPGTPYTGYLTQGASVMLGVDDATQIAQRGFASRTTRFALKTGAAGGGSGAPATFDTPQISGTNLVFNLKGTPGDVQRIESTTDLATWAKETEVTIPAGGSIAVTLPLASTGSPKFYRAIAVSSSNPTATPPTLAISLVSLGAFDITVSGSIGATYNVELTFDGTSWTRIATATIAADGKPVVVHASVPDGQNFALARASAQAGPPPPVVLLEPTLKAVLVNSNFGGFLAMQITMTGATPRRAYLLQQRNLAPDSAWGFTSQTIAADTKGEGSALIFVNRQPAGRTPPSGFLYRVYAK